MNENLWYSKLQYLSFDKFSFSYGKGICDKIIKKENVGFIPSECLGFGFLRNNDVEKPGKIHFPDRVFCKTLRDFTKINDNYLHVITNLRKIFYFKVNFRVFLYSVSLESIVKNTCTRPFTRISRLLMTRTWPHYTMLYNKKTFRPAIARKNVGNGENRIYLARLFRSIWDFFDSLESLCQYWTDALLRPAYNSLWFRFTFGPRVGRWSVPPCFY